MKPLTKILIGAVIILFVGLYTLGKLYEKSRMEVKREKQNVENLVKQHNQELNLKRSEFEKADTWWKHYLDSVNKAHDIALKSVKSATIIRTVYKDTTRVKIEYREPQKVDEYNYMVPINFKDSCWGMQGYIISADSTSTFELTERTAFNQAALEVTRHRFLGFLWWTKKTRFEAYGQCGKIDFVKIDFK